MQIIFVILASLIGTQLMCLGVSFGLEEGFKIKNTLIFLGGIGWMGLSFAVAHILQKKWRSEKNDVIHERPLGN